MAQNRAATRKYRETHPEVAEKNKERQRQRRSTPEGRAEHAAYMRQYWRDHPDKAEQSRQRARQRYIDNPDLYADNSLKHKFGIGLKLYDEMLARQGGKCGACGATDAGNNGRRFAIDHDHGCCPGSKTCGKCIRMLLCARCNYVLGRVKDDAGVLRALIVYLETFT